MGQATPVPFAGGHLAVEASHPAARSGCSWPDRQRPAIDGRGQLYFSRGAFRLWPGSVFSAWFKKDRFEVTVSTVGAGSRGDLASTG